MKNFKILLFAALFSIVAFSSNAQEYKSEISVSYGYYPVTDFADDWGIGIITLGQMHTENKSRLGSINVSYSYRFNKVFALGINYTYSQNEQNLYLKETLLGSITNNYNVIMPTAKFNWLNRNIITLYSKVAAGIYIGSVSNGDVKDIDKSSAVGFAYQASPIGIEIGKQFAFFAETGLGFNGTVIAGFRAKF